MNTLSCCTCPIQLKPNIIPINLHQQHKFNRNNNICNVASKNLSQSTTIAAVQPSKFQGFNTEQIEIISEFHNLMKRTFWALAINAGVNIVVLLNQFDYVNGIQFATQFTGIVVALSNCVLMNYSCQDFCKAAEIQQKNFGLPLILQGIERLSILFSNFSLIVTVLAIVQCMEAAITYPDVAIYIQIGLISLLSIRVALLSNILNIQNKENEDILEVRPLKSVYNLETFAQLPEWTPLVLGSYSLMHVLTRSNDVDDLDIVEESNKEYEFDQKEERILEVNMDDIFMAQISVTFLTVSTLLLALARYQEGELSEAFSSGVDVFEHLGLALALFGAQGSFQRVVEERGRDITNLLGGLSTEKGLGSFFEIWAVVNFGVALASLAQLGLFNGWLEVPFRKILSALV